MANAPIDPWLIEGLAATIHDQTRQSNMSLVDKLQGEWEQARSAVEGPLPGRDIASGAIGGLLGTAIGAALGGGEGAVYGAAGGMRGGLARAEMEDTEALDQYQKKVSDANKIIEDRMALSGKIGMLLQSGQGEVFKDIDPYILGEMFLPGSNQPIDVVAGQQKTLDEATKQELISLRTMLPYLAPGMRVPALARIADITNLPQDLVVQNTMDVRPDNVSQAAQLHDRLLNGAQIWMESVRTGQPVDWSKGVERPERITNLNGLAISGMNKLDAYMAEQNSKGIAPTVTAAAPLVMTPSELLAFNKAFDGLDGRPTASQMYRSWTQLAGQNAALRAMGIDIGPPLPETVVKDMTDLYSVMIIQNEMAGQNAHAERVRTKIQELYMDPKWADATPQAVQAEAVRQVNAALAGKGQLSEAHQTPKQTKEPRTKRTKQPPMTPERRKAIEDYNKGKRAREEDKKK